MNNAEENTKDFNNSNEFSTELWKNLETKTYLSQEFLLWIWYKLENEDLSNTLKKSGIEAWWLEDKLVLGQQGAQDLQAKLKGPQVMNSFEASVSLKLGRLPQELRLGFKHKHFGECSFTLQGKDLSPKSIKLMKPLEGAKELTAWKIQWVHLLTESLHQLVSEFLISRSGSEWQTKLWISGRSKSFGFSGGLH